MNKRKKLICFILAVMLVTASLAVVLVTTASAEGISIACESESVTAGGTLCLTAQDSKTGGTANVVWKVDDASIATVDENGVLTAVGSGTVTVTATAADGSTAVKQITVAGEQVKLYNARASWTQIDAFDYDYITYYTNAGVESDIKNVVAEGGLDSSGQWQHWTGAHLHNSSCVQGNYIKGNYAEFKFKGTAVRMRTQYRAPNTSDINYYIDGVLEGTATNLSANNDTSNYIIFEVTGLEDERHTVKVESATMGAMPVDYFEVIGTPISNSEPIKVESIKVTPENANLKIGGKVTLNAVVLPDDATDKSLVWESSDKNVATVSAGGVVTAKGVGEATITVAAKDDSGAAAEVKIVVRPEPEEIAINAPAAISLGQAEQLTAEILTEGAQGDIVWQVKPLTGEATITNDGTITGTKAGYVVVRAAYADDLSVYAFAAIEVK